MIVDGHRRRQWLSAAAGVRDLNAWRPPPSAAEHAIVGRQPSPSSAAHGNFTCRWSAAAAGFDTCQRRRPPHLTVCAATTAESREDAEARRRPPLTTTAPDNGKRACGWLAAASASVEESRRPRPPPPSSFPFGGRRRAPSRTPSVRRGRRRTPPHPPASAYCSSVLGGCRRGLLSTAAAATLHLNVRRPPPSAMVHADVWQRPPPSTAARYDGSRAGDWSAAAAIFETCQPGRPPDSTLWSAAGAERHQARRGQPAAAADRSCTRKQRTISPLVGRGHRRGLVRRGGHRTRR